MRQPGVAFFGDRGGAGISYRGNFHAAGSCQPEYLPDPAASGSGAAVATGSGRQIDYGSGFGAGTFQNNYHQPIAWIDSRVDLVFLVCDFFGRFAVDRRTFHHTAAAAQFWYRW